MYTSIVKPFFDKAISFLALVVISPVIFIVFVVLLFANRGKVWFKQERPGKNGKLFTVIKFKTMSDQRDEKGNLLPDERRLTATGKFIRKTSLDEIPQLFNVLTGHMSFVGPRPLLKEYLPLYNEEQRKRHLVKPGITGWAQVNGWRGNTSLEKRIEYDLYYIENWSVTLDLKIMWLTIVRGLFQRAHA